MPYYVTVDEAARTIIVTGSGTGTTADTLQLIADQQEMFSRHAGFNFIYDSSNLVIASSPADMMAIADALFTQARATFRKFAIVVPESRLHLARMFTALADPYGVNANVFVDLGDARRWVGIDRD